MLMEFMRHVHTKDECLVFSRRYGFNSIPQDTRRNRSRLRILLRPHNNSRERRDMRLGSHRHHHCDEVLLVVEGRIAVGGIAFVVLVDSSHRLEGGGLDLVGMTVEGIEDLLGSNLG
jgi:mannose-6-phosphate isomerase-like protein (cupin superfamily)